MELQVISESTETLVDRIERLVRLRTSGQVRGLRVEILPGEPGEIVISGRTSTYYAKQLATHAALDVSSNLPLTNEIEVY
ncbi:MAG: hypothetical protein HZA46_04415 [Planctomycetales bacterium]|nr:hypothetical protein [Planctomycetales bacterium]